METDWILGVIADLRTFAELNGMPDLAAKLRETADVAAREIDHGGTVETVRVLSQHATCAAGHT